MSFGLAPNGSDADDDGMNSVVTRNRRFYDGKLGQDKRACDAWDLYGILVDLDADASVCNALVTGSSWSA